MKPLTLHFDFSSTPLPDDPDGSHFRYRLSRDLQRILNTTGAGRWRGGRYARGWVTIFLEVHDRQTALEQLRTVIDETGALDRLTVGRESVIDNR